jgi:methionyl-tRNA formyltransferase
VRIIFWGTPDFALPALRALGDEGHEVAAVVTQPDRPAGRGRQLLASAVKREAREQLIPVLQPEKARGEEFLAQLRALEADLSVVVAYGQILRPEVLALPRLGSLNIHGSLLPALRGAAPVQWAIIRGLRSTGVSIMRMDAGLDSGPVLLRVEEPIESDESACELAGRLAEIGAEALVETLALLEAGGVVVEPQDHALASYAPKLDRAAARLDWTLPAAEVARWVRGLDDTPGGWSQLAGSGPVKLFRPQPAPGAGVPGQVLQVDDPEGIVVACGQGALRLAEVQPPGKRRMRAEEWVRGRGVAVGDRFGGEA